MNIKSLFVLAFFSAVTTVANAGTLTIKAPPPGLKLLTGFGELQHGDKDLVLPGVSMTSGNISPIIGKDIVGFITFFRGESPDWRYGNMIDCELKGKYSLEIEIVGYKKLLCKNETASLKQLRTEGSGDVVLTFAQIPKTN